MSSAPGNGGRFGPQLLKWVGNKQRQAPTIIGFFPTCFETYFEPFLGSGGVLGVLAPGRAIASDGFLPLVEIWRCLLTDKEQLKRHYADRYALLGGVVRFRKMDGYMSTPVGIHDPIHPDRFALRVDAWHARTVGAEFHHLDFAEAMDRAGRGDLVYCDPPYRDSQRILYGAQSFSMDRLLQSIAGCKSRGARVALSIDGTKLSGRKLCEVPVPDGLFVREEFISVGRSMLKRFQMEGGTLEAHEVSDRLLLTY